MTDALITWGNLDTAIGVIFIQAKESQRWLANHQMLGVRRGADFLTALKRNPFY